MGELAVKNWVRFEANGAEGFGTLDGDAIAVHAGDMFADAETTGETLALGDVALLTPCVPGKFIALWNNSQSAAEKQGLKSPSIRSSSSSHRRPISRRAASSASLPTMTAG